MFCYSCGLEQQGTPNFCSRCGTNLSLTNQNNNLSNNSSNNNRNFSQAGGGNNNNNNSNNNFNNGIPRLADTSLFTPPDFRPTPLFSQISNAIFQDLDTNRSNSLDSRKMQKYYQTLNQPPLDSTMLSIIYETYGCETVAVQSQGGFLGALAGLGPEKELTREGFQKMLWHDILADPNLSWSMNSQISRAYHLPFPLRREMLPEGPVPAAKQKMDQAVAACKQLMSGFMNISMNQANFTNQFISSFKAPQVMLANGGGYGHGRTCSCGYTVYGHTCGHCGHVNFMA